MPGLADASLELLEKLGAKAPVLVGWSLGGAVAIEMLSRAHPIAGLVIVGAPPVGPNKAEGFRGNLLKGLASQGHMTRDDATRFVEEVFEGVVEPFMVETVLRTDPEFRSLLFSAHRLDEKSNQRNVVSSTTTPTAVVNGENDPIVNLDYIAHVPFSNLWRQRFLVPGSAHAPFLQAPAVFNAILADFLADTLGKAAAPTLQAALPE